LHPAAIVPFLARGPKGGRASHLYRFESKGNTFKLSIDGSLQLSASDPSNTLPDPGQFGLEISGCDITVSSFRVIAL
jgi:hypothetical protein